VIVYPATAEGWQRSLADAARSADLLIKASGIGVFDSELDHAVADVPSKALRIYWDVDAPATLQAVTDNQQHHLRGAIPRYDLVLTYGGGDRVTSAYRALGARDCVPIYNALDPATHFPAPWRSEYDCDLGLLANRLPDRENRIEEFFIEVAQRRASKRFTLGGSGWETKSVPDNIRKVGHVGTGAHNAFFASGRATLNVNRASMVQYGFSPPTRIFEAAGAGACLITDSWQGIDFFLEPNREVLVATNGAEVAEFLDTLTPGRARDIARRARRRVLAHHTYHRRAIQFQNVLEGMSTRTEAAE
jgi:spore maturation protein CgeB